MAGIRDYNSSPALNVATRGVVTTEGMQRSDVNNWVRAIQADLKDFATEYDAGTGSSVSVARQYPRAKKWTAPSDMNNPLKIWIDCDGKTFSFNKSAYDAADWSNEVTGISHYYIDFINGNDANAGTSPGAAWKNATYAATNCVDKSILHWMNRRVGYNSLLSGNLAFGTKRVKFVGEHPDGPTIFTGWNESYTLAYMAWVADGLAYKSTSAVVGATIQCMFDDNYQDAYGIALAMPHVADLATVKTTPGSFNWDGTTLSVHMIDGRVPDVANGWIVGTTFSAMNFQVDADIAMENCTFVANGGAAAQGCLRFVNVTPFVANTYKVALKNVRAFGGSGNAFEIYDKKTVALENCYGGYCHADIFNLTSFITTGIQAQWMTCYLENCYGHDAGYLWRQYPAISNSNNLVTGHRGMHLFRVNIGGYNIPNSWMADVQGCYSLNAGISPTESQSGGFFQNNYWAQKLSGEGSANAKMILIGCDGEAVSAGKYHFSNWNDGESAATLGEIHLADWLGPTPLEPRTGTIVKNYETGVAL